MHADHADFDFIILVLECRFLLFFSSFDFFFFVPQLGTCVAQDANPAANITWLKDNKPLVADGKGAYSSSCFMFTKANKTALWSDGVTFINITFTNVFILSAWDCKFFL